MGTPVELPAGVQQLYDQRLYLQAYELSRECWAPSTDISCLSVEQLVLGGRLATRLGGARLARWLFRAAAAREPDNPQVRLFLLAMRRRRRPPLLQDLMDFQILMEKDNPNGDFAHLLAAYGCIWASLRDFTRADECIRRARCRTEDDWVLSCASNVLALSDRWTEALDAAESAWQAGYGAPYAAHSLGNSLMNLGRVEESAARLTEAALKGESYEVALLAAAHQCALVDALEPGEARGVRLQQALDLLEKLPALAPLADRDTKLVFARAHVDAAHLSRDLGALTRWVPESRLPYYRAIWQNLSKNPSGRRCQLPHRRLKQKHQTCLPSSVAVALSTMGISVDDGAMADEITYGGTPWGTAADWLERRGLVVRFFPVTAETAKRLLAHGIGFVLSLITEDFVHAVAAVGIDEGAGTLLLHDPAWHRTAEYLLESMGTRETPFGPIGAAIVPSDKLPTLTELLPVIDTEVTGARMRHPTVAEVAGAAAARGIVEDLGKRYPGHPVTQFLQALQSAEEGSSSEAFVALRDLLKPFPGSGSIRMALLSVCRSLGNTAHLREVLAEVVDRGRLPGVESRQPWNYPPVKYVCEYADCLGTSASTRGRAKALLYEALRRQPDSADVWRVLGESLRREENFSTAQLALRLASCLAQNNENYARAYSRALGEMGKEAEGLAWLEERAHRLGTSPRGVGAWVSWIAGLEFWGHPERALAACTEAMTHHGDSPVLQAFAVPFYARMGHWQEAQGGLEKLEASPHRKLYCEAACGYYSMQGDLNKALALAWEWVREAPWSTIARAKLLELTTRLGGASSAAQYAVRWVVEYPSHDELEKLYISQPDSPRIPRWKKDRVLLRRVRRNPEDGWAWRELSLRRMADYAAGSERRRERLKPRIWKPLSECDRTAPENPATLRAHAQWHEVQGHWPEALELWLMAAEADPSDLYSYRHAWDCCASMPVEEQRRNFDRLEPLLLACPNRLTIARDLLMLVAGRLGVDAATTAARRWKESRPHDPEVLRAWADVMLQFGQGRADAAQALAVLQPAVANFPYDPGLRFSLAIAWQKLAKHEQAEATLQEIVRRHPDNIAAHRRLAEVMEQRGKHEEAKSILEAAERAGPCSPEIWTARIQTLIQQRSFAPARALIQESLKALPGDAVWLETAIIHLDNCGAVEETVRLARDAIRAHPRNARLWNILGAALAKFPAMAAPGEVDSCLRRSIQCNGSFLDPADRLAMILAAQHRYDEAEEVIRRIAPRLSDPCPAHGRLAWLLRQRGEKSKAREKMAQTLLAAPWYRWGWTQLLAWIVEDQAWSDVPRLLGEVPAALSADLDFRRKRLEVLGKAQTGVAKLDQEWQDLLRNFPENLPLHLQRYDLLREAKRTEDAAVLLARLQAMDLTNPLVRVRVAGALADTDKQEDALEIALSIWFADVETSRVPAAQVWQAFCKARLADELYRRARRRFTEGHRPTPQAISIMANCAAGNEMTKRPKRARRIWQELFPSPAGKELLFLLRAADRLADSSARIRAELLQRLVELRYNRRVVWYWWRHRAALESDPLGWGCAVVALTALRFRRVVRRLFQKWRTRPGVEMCMVTNLVLCCVRYGKSQWQEIRSICSDALAGLPHDHSARYLAHNLAEMCVLLKDPEGFRNVYTRYRSLFGSSLKTGEFFSLKQKYLLAEIPQITVLLAQQNMPAFRKARRELLRKRLVYLFLADLYDE